MENVKRKDNQGRILRKGESQRKDLSYVYRWTDVKGKRNQVYASTLNELRKKEEKINKEISIGITRTNITLEEQIKIYLATKVNLENSTMENYIFYFKHSIKGSQLGKMKITDIKKSDILLFYNYLYREKNYKPGTIKILQKLIRPSLQLACDDDIIFKNPANGCTKDYSECQEKKYALTFDEEKEFLDRIKSRPRMKRYYPMYAIILKTGLRISEAVGLTWEDVDMSKKQISVNHQVQYRMYHGEKVQFYVNTPKTKAGIRIIPMTDEVHKLFLEQRKVWMQTKKDPDFEIDGYNNFVFVSHMTGRCMNHGNIRRSMRDIVNMNSDREVQLPPISPHILRHTTCCRLAESGCDIKVLQCLMGHEDIRTTMKVYNHADQERIKREIDRLEILKSSTPIYTNYTPNEEKVM